MSKAETFVNNWLRHRLVVEEILETIPQDQHMFKPWDNAMSLQELTLHIATSADMFVETVHQGQLVQPSPLTADIQSMDDVRHIVSELTAKTKATLNGLSDEQIARVIDVTDLLGAHLPGKALLTAMHEHEIHHKGQLFVYARMIGVEQLPMFVKVSV